MKKKTDEAGGIHEHGPGLMRAAGAAASIAVFLLAVWFLHRQLATISWQGVTANIQSHSMLTVWLAAACAAAGYAVLTGYDALAIRYIGRSLPYGRTAVTSFMAFAVGHNVGIAALSGGSVRYRMYSTMDLKAGEIAQVIVFCSITFAVGGTALIGAALLFIPAAELNLLGLPNHASRALGAILWLGAAAYVCLPLLRRSPVSLGNWRIGIPAFSITLTQLCLSIADLSFAAGTLYVLLVPDLGIGFLAFLGIYLAAIAAGLLSSVPGGVGVFEAVLLLALPGVDRETLLGTIVIYRLIYYIAPLAVAVSLIAGHEVRQHRQRLRQAGRLALDRLSSIAPEAFGSLAFLAGVILLVSGELPAVESRLRLIAELFPHPLLEASHLAGSVLGLCLLILARGLFHRLHGAHRLTVGILLAGIVVSLLKGLDYEEASLLALIALLLWAAQDEFYRRAPLGDQTYSLTWVAAIVVALAGSVWIGLFSHRHVAYSGQLWWQFSLYADAPRMLRGALAAVTTAIAFAVWKLMRPARQATRSENGEDLRDARQIVALATDASANAALLGDKRFLFDAGKSAFLMYQVSGRSWIALGDPVGPEPAHQPLVWQFRELCDRYDARSVFYQVADDRLHLYVDMGLTVFKLGEEARVPLTDFSLEGSARADLRQARNRATRAGAQFSVVPRMQVGELMPALQAVSDAWLADKAAAEKGFSLGRFSPEYLENFDCAVVRVADQLVAFANLWPAPHGGELSIDLMRHTSNAPKGVMDYLFVELMLWAKAQGYQWFSLGMAPLSGLQDHPLAPLWQKVGNLLFRHGEDFYNFEGLRAYKEKFDPVWRSRYLACPSGLVLPRALLDATALIAGGLKGAIGK